MPSVRVAVAVLLALWGASCTPPRSPAPADAGAAAERPAALPVDAPSAPVAAAPVPATPTAEAPVPRAPPARGDEPIDRGLYAASAPFPLSPARFAAYSACAEALVYRDLFTAPLSRWLRLEGMLLVLELDGRVGFAVFRPASLDFYPLPERPLFDREYLTVIRDGTHRSYSSFQPSSVFHGMWPLHDEAVMDGDKREYARPAPLALSADARARAHGTLRAKVLESLRRVPEMRERPDAHGDAPVFERRAWGALLACEGKDAEITELAIEALAGLYTPSRAGFRTP
jgi:hypothetical protein